MVFNDTLLFSFKFITVLDIASIAGVKKRIFENNVKGFGDSNRISSGNKQLLP